MVQGTTAGQVAELNVVPQKAIKLALDTLKKEGKYRIMIEAGGREREWESVPSSDWEVASR